MSFSKPAFKAFSILVFASSFAFGQSMQEKVTQNLRLLLKDSSLQNHFSIDTSGIHMYASIEAKIRNHPEFEVSWQNMGYLNILFKSCSREKMLSYYQGKTTEIYPDNLPSRTKSMNTELILEGMRIALDPGHMAENRKQARWEERYMRVKEKGWFKRSYRFYEADLAYSTAYILKDLLEKKGAQVLISREKDMNAIGIPFSKWYKHHFKKEVLTDFQNQLIDSSYCHWLLHNASKREVYKSYFKYKDFDKRVQRINNWYPDVTFIIHYNADDSGKRLAHNKNFCMAFTAGSFAKGELKTTENRMDFLRLLISDDLRKSGTLASEWVRLHKDSLHIPVVPPNAQIAYLTKYSILTEFPGVYARNLLMTRKIKGTLCFGESLLQENLDEARRLARKDFHLKDISTSQRVNEVAHAYYHALINYMEKYPGL